MQELNAQTGRNAAAFVAAFLWGIAWRGLGVCVGIGVFWFIIGNLMQAGYLGHW